MKKQINTLNDIIKSSGYLDYLKSWFITLHLFSFFQGYIFDNFEEKSYIFLFFINIIVQFELIFLTLKKKDTSLLIIILIRSIYFTSISSLIIICF
ncbi:MAG: hypothetical protein CMF96_02355 [Candidatus Marinimicrobia bacterium]|nr:hypothetical protein [Candidatus Neomarinimicrobiota bacterium]